MISPVNQCTVDSADAPLADDVAHLTSALARAQVIPDPFPYALIENFLPEDLADTLRAESETGKGPGWTGDHMRASRFLTQGVGHPDGETEAGARATAALSALPVVEAARTLFDGHLHEEAPVDRLLIGLELMRDNAGFMLPPHTDGAARLVGCLVYLADPGDPEELGTRLYRPLDPDIVARGQNSVWWDKVEEVTTAPFRRNLALIWARSDRSFHAVPMNVVDRSRRALQWCIERF